MADVTAPAGPTGAPRPAAPAPRGPGTAGERPSCPRCDAPTAAGDSYCTSCGLELAAAVDAPAPAASRLPTPDATIVACPACQAPNAASRARCARCREALSDDAPPLVTDSPVPVPAGDEHDHDHPPRVLLAVVAAAACVLIAVLVALLRASGTGPFAGPRGVAAVAPSPLPVEALSASSSLPGGGSVAYGPENLVDGDPATAWNEGAAGSGAAEWVLLQLREPAPVRRLLVWNGYQKGAEFGDNARVRTLRIELGGRTFAVDLLDTQGPQAVDLPGPVPAASVRLVIDAVYPGERYQDAALSEVAVLG